MTDHWDEIYGKGRERPPRGIIKTYSNYFIGKVLDVGCGTFIPPYPNWTGLESNKIAVEELRKRGAKAIHGTIYNLPEGYDTIACMMTLEHLKHPSRAVDEMCEMAEKRIIIGGPNYFIYNQNRSLRNLSAYFSYWLNHSSNLEPTSPKMEKEEYYGINEIWLRRRLKQNGWRPRNVLKHKIPLTPFNMMGKRFLLIAEPSPVTDKNG